MSAPPGVAISLPGAGTCAGSLQILNPGDVAVGQRGDRLETLLGSCVAIVLTDPRRTIGAMCHIVHGRPAPPGHGHDSAFADVALERMRALLRAQGITPALCEAFVYGGGNMFPAVFRHTHVGDDNAAWALRALAADGIRVMVRDTGGDVYRRIGWTIGPSMPDCVAVAV
jgi:chemotaxis protein CheD